MRARDKTRYSGLMSSTRTVPAPVPSVFLSPMPEAPSSAWKYSAPLKTVNPEGLELVARPGLGSRSHPYRSVSHMIEFAAFFLVTT
jgi:hypothetical protein